MTRNRSVVLLLVSALLLTLFGAVNVIAQDQPVGRARVRVAHLAIDLPNMDAQVGELVLATGLPYGTISGYVTVNAGTQIVALIPSGATADFALAGPIELQFEADRSYIIAATGQRADNSFTPIVIDETAAFMLTNPDMNVLNGKARVIVLHGISDAPSIDLVVAQGGPKAIENLPFGSFSALVLDPGDYPLVVTAAGSPDTVVFNDLNPVRLEGDRLYFLAAAGTFPTDFRLVQDVTGTKTLVELINTTPELSTLLTALEASGLTESLRADGPFTVFAPSNDAFAALPADLLQGLLADPAELTRILLYHVAPNRILSTDLVLLTSVPTIAQSDLTVLASPTQIALNDTAQVVRGDLLATNGVIHIIGQVLIP